MRRRQSGSMGQGLNQIQVNMSGERPTALTGNFQESDKTTCHGRTGPGGKGLFAGQHKIKLNSSSINHHQQNAAGMSRLNSDNNVVIGGGNASATEAAMRNSHY
mmetsp:Transcript_22612/g.26597  ORF Transcript_22612/g.26597 Transcript_22612/m.26597 type:complete len:104 (+) Transcript_22612:379-690(+)